jgi:hypothetical protein
MKYYNRKNRLSVSENRVLRKYLDKPKYSPRSSIEEITGGWRKLRYAEVHNL